MNADCHYGDHDYSGATCVNCGYLNGALLAFFRFEKAEREGRAHSDHYHRTIDKAQACRFPDGRALEADRD